MAQLDLREKLEILADAAKYDASCASSGTSKRKSSGGKGLGSTEGMGICHAYAPDGRCISLLKILLTNSCIFDCHYCINRKSSNVRRARFTAQEVVRLTLDFYRRNYIEGLFLSSGIIRSPDYTMEQIVEVARSLREDHDFRGYIHLKTIPDADPGLIHQAGLHADRLSINVELPTVAGLTRLAPEKSAPRIEGAMRDLKRDIEDTGDARKRYRSAPKFAPAGQSTQMIVGADDHLGRLASGREFGGGAIAFARVARVLDIALQVAHRPFDPGGGFLRGEARQAGDGGQLDIDRQPVGVQPGLMDQPGVGVGDRLQMNVAAKVVILAQAARDLDNLLHRVIGRADDARGKEQPLDIIAAVEVEREADDLLRGEARAPDVRALAVNAIMAVEDAAVGQQDLEQADAAAIGGISVADAHPLGRTQPLAAGGFAFRRAG